MGANRPTFGRSERIRTSDPLLPKQVRYQAALHSAVVGPFSIATVPSLVNACSKFILHTPYETARLCGFGAS